MCGEVEPAGAAPDPAPLERRLQAIDPPPVPDDLLERCLATVRGPAPRSAIRRHRIFGWRGRAAAVAAGVLLLGVAAIVARPRPADAASLLQDVQKAGTRVAACHTVQVMRGPDGTRREEVWFVRDRGRREDIRIDDTPTALVVRNRRWEFRWDIRGRLVAAWSTEMNAGHRGLIDPDGRMLDGDEMARWAAAHRAEVKLETETVGGRKLRKITLKWPGPPSGGFLPRDETIWFEPDSLRPVEHRIAYDDGRSLEIRTDYPPPENVPDDLFDFRPPPDVTIEINDPDLGRQVYSEGRPGAKP
jgi:hypothetical protein